MQTGLFLALVVLGAAAVVRAEEAAADPAAAAAAAAPEWAGKLEVLTDDDFEAKTASGVWLIKFYAPWCGHCKRLAPIWEELAKTSAGHFHVAELDCTVHKKAATKLAIRGYPTIKFFENGVASDCNVPRTVKSYVDFVGYTAKSIDIKGKITVPEAPQAAQQPQQPQQPKPQQPKVEEPAKPTEVLVLTSENFDANVKDGFTIVKFYAPWCGHCKRLAPIWEDLAVAQKAAGQFKVAEVNADVERALGSKYKVNSYPTVLLFHNGGEPTKYQGPRTAEAFTEFVLKAKAAAGQAPAAPEKPVEEKERSEL